MLRRKDKPKREMSHKEARISSSPMRGEEIKSVLILGGTGCTGKHLIRMSLENGLRVTVLARRPEKLEGMQHASLEILKGDVLEYADVYNAVQGVDAVLSALGRDGQNVQVITRGTAHILRAIAQSSVKRLIVLSSMGAGSTHRLVNWKMKVIIWLAGLRNSFQAKAEQEIMLSQSQFDFTLVMASPLTNLPELGSVNAFSAHDWHIRIKMPRPVSRADVARFMICQLSSRAWKRKTVCVMGGWK